MAFLRPEVKEGLLRWRETLAGLAVAGYGLWLAAGGRGLDLWFGLAVAFAGAAMAWAGWQLARFRRARGGPGVVQVDERRIAYFGPVTGGIVALDDLERLEIGPGPSGHPVWRLFHEGGVPLEIPVNAEGAEVLFDAFAALPGLRLEPMLRALEGPPGQPAVIWQKGHRRLH